MIVIEHVELNITCQRIMAHAQAGTIGRRNSLNAPRYHAGPHDPPILGVDPWPLKLTPIPMGCGQRIGRARHKAGLAVLHHQHATLAPCRNFVGRAVVACFRVE
jgi:hypothetical protein